MFEHLVVPVDLSPASFEAVPVAARMVAQVGGRVDVITVVDRLSDVALARDWLDLRMGTLPPLPVEVRQLVHTGHPIAETIACHVQRTPGAMVAMRSHGHGRSAAVLGSTVDDLLRVMFGPVIVIGPEAGESSNDLGGQYIVPIDGSERADSVLPIVAAWAVEFNGTPWLVEVVDPDVDYPAGAGIVESSFVNRRAGDLAGRISRPVEFEVLHGHHAATSIVKFAESQNASLIFMTTHGRTGLDRLAAGSVSADVVRHAGVPVVLFRPPNMSSEE